MRFKVRSCIIFHISLHLIHSALNTVLSELQKTSLNKP